MSYVEKLMRIAEDNSITTFQKLMLAYMLVVEAVEYCVALIDKIELAIKQFVDELM